MRPNLDERTQNPRHESPYTRTSTTPPPCSAPGPPVPPNSAFSSPPTPPLPPRQKLPITQWNRPADFFAPRNGREGPQTRWMRVAGCCEWRVRKCACACRRGGGRLTINLDNPTAASDASSGRESARGARNSGSSPPRYSAFCQTQEGVSVSADWGGEDPRGTKNLPAKCKAVHEIVRSENRHMMGPDASMMNILLLGAEKVDVRSRDLPRPT